MLDPSCQVQRHALSERGDDLYETPPVAVEALLRHERLPHRLWDPCCGPGNIVNVLRAAGHEVIGSDLVDYGDPTHFYRRDFLMERKAPDGCEGVVMNAPFKLAAEAPAVSSAPGALSPAMYRKDLEMKRDEVFPSKYLKAADLNGKPVTVTIKSAPYETLKNPEGKEQGKTVLYFVGGKKALPLNVVNWDSVAAICGDDTDAWPGQTIELYPTVTSMGGKMVPCIRIRRPQGTLPLAARPSATPAPMPAETPPVESNAGTDVSRNARPRATPAPMPAETPPVEAYADADFGDDLPEAFR